MRTLVALTAIVFFGSLFICHQWRSGTITNAELDASRANLQNTVDSLGTGRDPELVEPDLAFPAEHPNLVPIGLSLGFFVIGLLVLIARNTSKGVRSVSVPSP